MSKIKMYKTMTCPYCKMETEYLKSKNVQFEEVYVDRDPVAAQEMIQKSGVMGVPLTEVIFDDGKAEYILGFDKARLDKALGLS